MLHLTQHLLHLQLCHAGHVKNKFIQFKIQFGTQQLSYTEVHKEQEEMPLQAPTLLLHRALTSNSWEGRGGMCYVLLLLLILSSLHSFSLWKQGRTNALSSSEKAILLLLWCAIQVQAPVSRWVGGGGSGLVHTAQASFSTKLLASSFSLTQSICWMTPVCLRKKVACLKVETLRLIGWIFGGDAESWLESLPLDLRYCASVCSLRFLAACHLIAAIWFFFLSFVLTHSENKIGSHDIHGIASGLPNSSPESTVAPMFCFWSTCTALIGDASFWPETSFVSCLCPSG